MDCQFYFDLWRVYVSNISVLLASYLIVCWVVLFIFLCVVNTDKRRVDIYYSTNYNKCMFTLAPDKLPMLCLLPAGKCLLLCGNSLWLFPSPPVCARAVQFYFCRLRDNSAHLHDCFPVGISLFKKKKTTYCLLFYVNMRILICKALKYFLT